MGTILTIVPTITSSCAQNKNNDNSNNQFNIDNEIDNSLKNIITEQSAINLDKLMHDSLIVKSNQLTKSDIKRELIINEDTFLNKEIIKINKLN